METTFLKPDIQFPAFPIINIWIQSDYKKVNSHQDLVNFIHNGLDEIETTNNQVRKTAYKKIILPLYSILTGLSYESKLNA